MPSEYLIRINFLLLFTFYTNFFTVWAIYSYGEKDPNNITKNVLRKFNAKNILNFTLIDIQLKYDCHESIFFPGKSFKIILIHRYIKLVSCSRLNG